MQCALFMGLVGNKHYQIHTQGRRVVMKMLQREISWAGEGVGRYTAGQRSPRWKGRAIHRSLWRASLKDKPVDYPESE